MPTIYFSTDGYRSCGKGFGLGMDSVAGFQLPGSFYQIDNDLLLKFMQNACRNYLNRGFKMVMIVSGHNPNIQQNLMDEVCYIMKTPDGKEPVQFTMEYTVIESGNPKRHSDHGGGYETSMMMYLAEDRVNMKANDGCEIKELATTGSLFPLIDASKTEGKVRFDLQVEGLARYTQEKFMILMENQER